MRTGAIMWVLCVTAVSLFGASLAMAASQAPEIAKTAGCLAFHGIDRKIISPAFAWVAYKYKDDKEEGKKAIIDRIANGGMGQWIRHTGGIGMPPYRAQTTEAQRNELADYIRGLDPIAPPN